MDISTEFYSPGYFPTSQAYEILYSCSHEIPPVKWKKSKSCCQRKHHFQWPPLRDWLNTRAILLMCLIWSSDSWNKGSPLFQLAVCKVILVSETRVHLCVWYHPFMDFTLYLKLPRVISTNWIYFADDVQITLPKGVRMMYSPEWKPTIIVYCFLWLYTLH